MIVAHDSECPALCCELNCGIYANCIHDGAHACTCHGAEKLRELVEAANLARHTKVESEVAFYVHSRLDAALAPFRAAPEEENPE